jgi:hypothetical protein
MPSAPPTTLGRACGRWAPTRSTPQSAGVALGGAARRMQPPAPQRPPPCPARDRPVTNAVALCIAGVLAPALGDTRLRRAPRLQTGIHAARLRVHHGAGRSRGFEAWLAGLVRPRGPQLPHPWPPTRTPATDGGLCLRQRATASLAGASASTTLSPLALADCGGPCMARSHRGSLALALVGARHDRLSWTLPARTAVVLCSAALTWRDNACALCACDTWRPLHYRHPSPPGSGGCWPATMGARSSSTRGAPSCHAERGRAGAVSAKPRVLPW